MRPAWPNHRGSDRASLPEVVPSQIVLDEAMVLPQPSADIVVQCELAIGENCTSVAILPDRLGVMRHENNISERNMRSRNASAHFRRKRWSPISVTSSIR